MTTYHIENFANIINNSYQTNIFTILAYILLIFIGILAYITLVALTLIYVERKVCAAIQCRIGPNRTGWWGLLQPVADAIKLVLKEKNSPLYCDKLLHFVAPMFCLGACLSSLLIIPFSHNIQVINLNVGILYWSAVSSLGILGILIAGWSSYNKWSLLGAIRSASQMLSYELSIILSIMVIVIYAGTLDVQKIVLSQLDGWWIFKGHIVTVMSFLIFFVASVAELNRTPFDLPEGESELGAGFHTEYSGIQFGFFFLAEYINVFITSAIIVTLFLGGWLPFHLYGMLSFNNAMNGIHPIIWFFLKVSLIIFVIVWIRWTLPRLRIDQLIYLEWKFLLPLGLINIVLSAMSVLYSFHF